MSNKFRPRSDGSIKRKRNAQSTPGPSINALKKRRRDLRRLLEHADNLPADVRVGYERELAACASDLERAEKAAKRSQIIKKYHMVRFFERKKATRTLKKAREALERAEQDNNTDSGKAELEDRAHAADVDLNYTMYFPLEQAYVSLYADKKDREETAHGRKNPMWSVVEEAMSQGKLQDLRDGKWNTWSGDATSGSVGDTPSRIEQPKTQKRTAEGSAKIHPKKKPTRRKEAEQHEGSSASDNEDGGAFFEN